MKHLSCEGCFLYLLLAIRNIQVPIIISRHRKIIFKYMISRLVPGDVAVAGGARYFIYRKREEEYIDYEDDDDDKAEKSEDQQS